MQTVLLVDDEQIIRDGLSEILNCLGYKVFAQPDPVSALAFLRGGVAVDLVLTDYRMPEMNGLDFAELVKKMIPCVPIIMLTGYGEVESYLRAMSLGLFEYVNKPIRYHELDKIMKAALTSAVARESDEDHGSQPLPPVQYDD